MKLISHMINVSYIREEDDNIFPRGITFDKRYKALKIGEIKKLSEDKYEEGTILGEERQEGWVIKTHYMGKGINSPKRKYRIAFEPVLENDESIDDFYLRIKVTNRDQNIDYLRYCPKNNLFFDTDYFHRDRGNIVRTLGLANDTAGRFFIEVIRKENNIVEKSIPILVLPSSLSYNDYLKMIGELREIREDIILNDKSKVGIGELWITKKDNIENAINQLEKTINIISKNPTSQLKGEYIKKSYNQINKITSKTLIEKSIYPYKDSFTAINYSENLDIYENRVIKYVLNNLKEKIKNYKEFYSDYIIEEKNNIEKIKNNFLKVTNSSVLEKRKEIKDKKDREESLIKAAANFSSEMKINTNFKLGLFKNDDIDDTAIKVIFDNERRMFRLQFNSIKNNIALGYSYYNKREIGFSGQNLRLFLYTNNINEMISFINFIKNKPINNMPSQIGLNISSYNSEEKISQAGHKYIVCTIWANSINSINGDNINTYSYDEKVEFLKKYIKNDNEDEMVAMLDSIVAKEEQIDNIQKEISYGESWDILERRIDKLLKLSIFKNISTNPINNIKLTQVFINNPYYRRIYKLIKNLNNNMLLINMKSPNAILVKSTSDIYEIWCLFKIVQVLITKQRWTLLNEDDVANSLKSFMELKEPFSEKQLDFIFEKRLIDDKVLSLKLIYEGRVYYSDNKFKTPDYQFIYTLKNTAGDIIFEKRVYLDAKYRNYDAQSEEIYKSDIKEVAIEKYIKTFEDTINEPVCSMIVHSHNDEKYINWGANQKERVAIDENLKPHGYGAFYLIPSNVSNLNKFIRMISEYHLSTSNFRAYSICWECGEIELINIETRLTYGRKQKYYYTCKKCNEFWVKNHCRMAGHHKLIKHKDNYHLSNKGSKNPWHLICPVCDDWGED